MTESRTPDEIGVSEDRRRDVAAWMFHPLDPVWEQVKGTDTKILPPPPMVSGESATLELAVAPPGAVAPAPEAPGEPTSQRLPTQGSVNRADRLTRMFVDIEVRAPDGTLIQILRYPVFGPYGTDPGDAIKISHLVNPTTLACGALPPSAAALCMAIGYW